MPIKLMYITNQVEIAKIAENCSVDWIFIDLEINGKIERQKFVDSVISKHKISDIGKIRKVISKSEILVRVNPIYSGSKEEINAVINEGADIVMLPFFRTVEEVKEFITLVNKRAKVCLLLETPEAAEQIDAILSLDGIDYVHIGLNDLHLGYKKKFMFELLSDGTVEALCKKFKQYNVEYGFGGIAQLGQGLLPAEYIIAEHYRLGSTMAILSRAFCNLKKVKDLNVIEELFIKGVGEIREYENDLLNKSEVFYTHNQRLVKEAVNEIVTKLGYASEEQ